MQDFLQTKLEDVQDIEEYYRTMADAALALGVQEKMLIELLINGLSVEMKTLTLTWEFARIPFHVLFLYLVPRI